MLICQLFNSSHIIYDYFLSKLTCFNFCPLSPLSPTITSDWRYGVSPVLCMDSCRLWFWENLYTKILKSWNILILGLSGFLFFFNHGFGLLLSLLCILFEISEMKKVMGDVFSFLSQLFIGFYFYILFYIFTHTHRK